VRWRIPSRPRAAARSEAAHGRKATAGGLAGATVAVAVVAVTLLTQTSLAEAIRPPPRLEAEAARADCARPDRCPEAFRDDWAARVGAQLEARLPLLPEADREALALTIVDEAERASIDPLLVLALIAVESSFDPAAASGRGARGLMQLRPSTMRHEAKRSGIAFDDPHEPIANVQAGVRYLKRLLDAFGREEVALMAYNAGPNRILKYLRAGEIPERFHAYPRRVKKELRRLRRSVAVEAAPLVAELEPASRPSRRKP
jgi:soluble lytic murein transglycosylase-like protein